MNVTLRLPLLTSPSENTSYLAIMVTLLLQHIDNALTQVKNVDIGVYNFDLNVTSWAESQIIPPHIIFVRQKMELECILLEAKQRTLGSSLILLLPLLFICSLLFCVFNLCILQIFHLFFFASFTVLCIVILRSRSMTIFLFFPPYIGFICSV